MAFKPIFKDPGDVIVRGLDWADFIAAVPAITGLATSAWSVTPDTMTVEGVAISGSQAKVKMTGGNAGETYCVTNLVTFNESDGAGRQNERSLIVKVEQL